MKFGRSDNPIGKELGIELTIMEAQAKSEGKLNYDDFKRTIKNRNWVNLAEEAMRETDMFDKIDRHKKGSLINILAGALGQQRTNLNFKEIKQLTVCQMTNRGYLEDYVLVTMYEFWLKGTYKI